MNLNAKYISSRANFKTGRNIQNLAFLHVRKIIKKF